MKRIFRASAFAAACLLGSGEPAVAQTVTPQIQLERDPNGALYIHVMEPFDHASAGYTPTTTIQNQAIPRTNISSTKTWFLNDTEQSGQKYGIYVSGSARVLVDGYNFTSWNGGGSIHGGGIKQERSSAGDMIVRDYFGNPNLQPDASYDKRNVDCLGNEFRTTQTLVRYATCLNWGDGALDTKSGNWLLANVTIGNVNRGLRLWSGSNVTIVDSIVNVPVGEQIWFEDTTAGVSYYNVLWCRGAGTNPSPSNPNCSYSPQVLGIDNGQRSAMRITRLTANPLTHPLFAHRFDHVVVQYSRDGGSTWATMATPNSGDASHPLIGDTRYKINVSTTGGVLFRAIVRRGSTEVGRTAAIKVGA